jgi:hypothetical protein
MRGADTHADQAQAVMLPSHRRNDTVALCMLPPEIFSPLHIRHQRPRTPPACGKSQKDTVGSRYRHLLRTEGAAMPVQMAAEPAKKRSTPPTNKQRCAPAAAARLPLPPAAATQLTPLPHWVTTDRASPRTRHAAARRHPHATKVQNTHARALDSCAPLAPQAPAARLRAHCGASQRQDKPLHLRPPCLIVQLLHCGPGAAL